MPVSTIPAAGPSRCHLTRVAIPIVRLFGRFNAGWSEYLLGLLKVAAEREIPGG